MIHFVVAACKLISCIAQYSTIQWNVFLNVSFLPLLQKDAELIIIFTTAQEEIIEVTNRHALSHCGQKT